MNSRRRIAVVLPTLGGGGAERVKVSIAAALAALGHDVYFALLQAKGAFLDEVKRDFEVVDLRVDRLRGAVVPLWRHFEASRPDAVLADVWPLTTVVALAQRLSRTRPRLLLTEQNTLSRQYASKGDVFRLLMGRALALNSRLGTVAGVSDGVVEDLARLTGRSADAFVVTPNVVPTSAPTSKTRPEEVQRVWGGSGRPRILNVGSLKAQKNQEMLLRAFSRLDEFPEARLLVLGEGELRGDLEALAIDLGIADRVEMPGFVDEPAAYYRSADLFALSSNYEGLSLALLEAMAAGMRVAATDCPSGTAEVLHHGELGALSPVGDHVAFAGAMKAALDAPHEPARQRSRAADFSPDRAAARALELLFSDSPRS